MRGTGWKNRGQEIYRREEERIQALWRSRERGGETAHTKMGEKKRKEELVRVGSRWMMGLLLTLAVAELTVSKAFCTVKEGVTSSWYPSCVFRFLSSSVTGNWVPLQEIFCAWFPKTPLMQRSLNRCGKNCQESYRGENGYELHKESQRALFLSNQRLFTQNNCSHTRFLHTQKTGHTHTYKT